jgi:hypothetical protein
MAQGLYYYYLFKTSAPDGSAFFGIHRTENSQWGQDGQALGYIGNGPKLAAKARQYGIQRLVTETMYTSGDYNDCVHRLDQILTPATLADPRCLNMPRPETNKKISEALIGKPKSEEHKDAIAKSMEGNQNAVKITQNAIQEAMPQVLAITPEEARLDKQLVEDASNLVWIHNKTTGEEMQLPADEDIITGFETGRLPLHLRKKFKGKDHKIAMSDADRARMIRD